MRFILGVLIALLSISTAYADGTATGSGASRQEACAQAQSVASNNGEQVSSDCSCEDRGGISVCQVQCSAEE